MTHQSSLRIGRALLAALALGFAATSAALAASGTRYYVNDHLATTVGIADAAGEIAALEADAFGAPLAGGANAGRFTGKPYDEDLGAYVFPFRNYRAHEARWMSADPSGFPDGKNTYFYVGVVPTYIDPFGLSGTLTLHSGNDGGSSSLNSSGHAWITYTPDANGQTTSYGTWGNNPSDANGVPLGNGLHQNLEQDAGLTGQTTITLWIDDAGEQSLYNTIAEYVAQGADAWSLFGPCSTFAADAWNSGTGQNLSPGFPSTPTSLMNSIRNANGGHNHTE